MERTNYYQLGKDLADFDLAIGDDHEMENDPERWAERNEDFKRGYSEVWATRPNL